MKKLLRAVPTKFLPIASTIEQFGDLKTMTVEETVGSLKVHEERLRGSGEQSGGQLLMTREEWLKRTGRGEGSSGSRPRRDFGRGGRDRGRLRCYNYQGFGHFAADCKKPKREKENN